MAAPVVPQPDTTQPVNTRPGIPLAELPDALGLLSGLAGSWIGTGFNLVSLPDFDSRPPSTGPAPFRVLLSSTVEILEFTPIGGKVPNRGSTNQDDIDIVGLRYLQRVADRVTNQALHIEPGFWLSVPATTVPSDGPTIVRQASIPHGTSVLAIGQGFEIPSGPRIDPVSSTPLSNPPGQDLSGKYLEPLTHPTLPLPPGFDPGYIANMNQALLDAIAGQTIVDTVVLIISTRAPAQGPAARAGGTLNIPFDISNANATSMDAIFWIETVRQADGSTFVQLQYTQTVILNFLGIDWPHISVATLVKQ
ncbi:heme-binding protein [Actinomycetospora chiangmaiensis]|uniref:heme-binding protein n=1 Tax=Actinomycetospora chiangmaiensis TaxID=402650 RepID=UPI00036C11CB|nr:heme-binding protein [Actinomycetospora chiangmaiensis]